MSGARGIRGLCWGAVITVFAVGACGGDREPQPSSSASAPVAARSTLPAQAVALAQGSVLAANAGGFSNQPKQGRATLSAIAPPRADGATKLSANAIHLELRSEGAADRQAEIDDGKVIYRDAFTDTDVLIAAHGARFEELRILRSAKAPATARYRLKANGTLRLEKGSVEVLDDAGRPQLRTLPAYAVDAAGTTRALELTLDTTRGDAVLIAKLDTTGLVYPIVVDPTWVTGTSWPAEAVVALNSVWLKEHSTVTSTVNGTVAVIDASPGPVLADSAEAVVGQNVTVNGTVSANRVRIKQGGAVNGDVRTNTLVNNGSISGATVTPLALPLAITVPAFPTFSAGTTPVTLEQKQDLTLAAGSYGDVLLRAGTTADPTVLTLSGGIYNLSGLNLGDKSRVECAAPCEIRIKNRLEPGQGAYLGPATGSGLGAPDVQVFVEGINGSSGNLGGTPKAAAIGFDNTLIARVLAPNGTLWIKQGSVANGVFVARDVSVGEGVQLTKDVTTPCSGPIDDGNPCTADSCDPGTGQVHHDPLASGASCSNGNVCDGAETCDGAGSCQAGTALPTDDGNPCTTDACNPTSGVSHTPVAAGTSCSDGNACNGAETCNAGGACQAGTPPNVDDGDACTADSCDPQTGVVHAPLTGSACDDGNACTQTDTCQAGTCAGSNPVVCTASDQCHDAGTCNPATGACTNPAKATGSNCDDGDACTQTDSCQSGACAGSNPIVCTATDQCHVAGTCNPSTGTCSNPPKANGASCDDGDACTQTDTCNAGSCAGGSPVACTALDQCHDAGTCAPATGICSNPPKADGASCDDGNACTVAESCSTGACGGGTPVAIDDGNPCTADSCSPLGGVVHTPVAAGTACNDADLCNGGETCDGAGVCQSGTPIPTSDGNACTLDACDPNTGVVSHSPSPAGTMCNFDLCTIGALCDTSGQCLGGSPLPVDDGDACTIDLCDPVLGIRHVGCSALDRTVSTTLLDSMSWLLAGPNPVQPGVAAGAIDVQRAAVLYGRISSRSGGPIPGVAVSVLGHPEFGQTQTHADGRYFMMVNGGGEFVVEFAKPGYLPAQRSARPPWGEFASTADVVLVPLTSQVTSIDLSSPQPFQVARGVQEADANGTRQATMLFAAGTTATARRPDGSTFPLTELSVRATEYTVGASGPEAMPALLPPASMYTYAAELSVDEALASGASIQFSQPVWFYLENFLGFPAGTVVPLGSYDRPTAQWIPQPSGVVLAVLGHSAGKALIDSTGDGLADSPSELATISMSDAELYQLASLYSPGVSVWRTPVTQFSPKDWNWGWMPDPTDGPPPPPKPDDPDPDQPDPEEPDDDDGQCKQDGASSIACQTQKLRETVRLPGTPHSIHYASDRLAGRATGNTIELQLSTATPPPRVKRILLEVAVAGRTFTQVFPPAPNQLTTFTWDGKDAFGRPTQGMQRVRARVRYIYDVVYTTTLVFGEFGSQPIAGPILGEYSIDRDWNGRIGRWDASALGLGGWSLDVHHAYDPVSRTLFKGDGSRRSASSIVPIFKTLVPGPVGRIDELAVYPDETVLYVYGNVVRRLAKDGTISTFAGGGLTGYAGDGGPATAASLRSPQDVVIAPDGAVYIADTGNHVVRRVGLDGIITTVAGVFTTIGGLPVGGNDGDGGPATSARIYNPIALAYGPDGGLYISNGSMIRKVGPDGVIRTIAGTGTGGFLPLPADDVQALQADLSAVDFAFDRQGNLYFADNRFSRVRRLDRAGRVTTVAGCVGTPCLDASGVPATQRQLNNPLAVAIGPDDTLYVGTHNDQTVHAVGADGIIRRVAGGGSGLASGVPATSVQLFVIGLAMGQNGRMYVAGTNTGLHVIESPLPSLSASYVIPSQEASEVYSFDSDGRHLQTLDARTGAARTTFAYGATGFVSSLTDGDGNVTTIQRDASGTPTGVGGPFGHQTSFAVNSSGFLSAVTNPAGEAVAITYSIDGNLESLTNARGQTSTMLYDGLGRLLLDTDAASGSFALARTDLATGWSVSRTSALGRTSSYLTEFLPTGVLQQTNAFPDGTVAVRSRDKGGTVVLTTPDGTRSTSTNLPDSRFSLMAPVVSTSTRTPSGLVRNETRTRSINLTDLLNPLSLSWQTDTVSVNGRTTTTVFNRATLTTTVTSPAGRISKTFHDPQMRVTRREVTGITPIVVGHDSRGRLATVTQGPRTRSTTYFNTSDSRNGYVQWVTNALGQTTSFSPDATGRILQQLDPDGALTSFAWDGNSNLTSVTPPGQPAHGQSFTPVDLLSAYTPPSVPGVPVPSTLFAYNLDKQLTQTTRPDGLLIGRTYDSAGKLDLLTTPTGNVDYDYFGLTPCPGCAPGRLQRITDPSGVVLDHAYDGLLLKSLTWSGAVSGTVSFGHDASFRVTSETVTVGANTSSVAFGLDNDDLLICASPSTCSPAGTDALKITLNAGNGLVTGSTHGLVTDTLTYNAFGELASYAGKVGVTGVFSEVVATTAVPRDALGRIVQRVETNGGASTTWRYAYDLRGRLIDVQKDGSLFEHYDYDGNGNRTLLTTPSGTTVGVYDAQDRLLSYGSTSYTYTANGELRTKTDAGGTTTYTHDVRGNLVQVDLPSGDVIQYLVDGQDRRVGKKKNGVLEKAWLYRNQLNPAAELDGAGNLVGRFVYGSKSNVPEYVVRGGVTYRVLSDHLGSPRALVDVATGTVAWRADFDAWGNRTLIAGTADFVPFGFAGGMFDAETGLTRFGARDYDARVGRWTGKDPIGLVPAPKPGSAVPNAFGYAWGDSVNRADPSGRVPLWVVHLVRHVVGHLLWEIFVSPAYHVPEQSAEEKFAEQCFLAGLDPQACCVDPSGVLVACTCGGANAPPQESVCPEVGGQKCPP